MAMATFLDIISQYPVLCELSPFLSTLDLFHLALTNKASYGYILSSEAVFNILKRDALCNGTGLVKRQDQVGLYDLGRRFYFWGSERRIWQDDPIEVRLYGTRCDEAGALPCIKCNINICEVNAF
jgi:hypothetical protein